jgi:alkylhydroperoxidase family enzyme
VLRKNFFSAEEILAILADHRQAGLEAQEVAVMDYAEKIALHAGAVSQDDVEALRRNGLSDEEILDVALAAAARCFFSKALDAVGAEPDAQYLELEPALRAALARGRPFG